MAPVFPPARAAGPLGLLLLDTAFPRPPGDLGRPDSWPGTVLTHVVEGAWPARVVQSAQGLRAQGLSPVFVEGARSLRRRGATAITTSCGFLVLLQRELQEAVADIPLVTSSLLLLPRLLRDEAQVGVLTIAADRLGAEHLEAAGVPRERVGDVKVQGMPQGGPFASAILGNRAAMDVAAAGGDVVRAARALHARWPGLRTLVLECTNMPPHREAIAAATGLRVLSLADAPGLRLPAARE